MNKQTLDLEFPKLKPALEGYLYRLLTNREDVADYYQNTYLQAEKSLNTFNGNLSNFKSWIFTIATRLALNHLNREKKWDKNSQDTCRNSLVNNEKARTEFLSGIDLTEIRYDIKEHIDFCFTCMNKTLPAKKQVALMLKDIYDFKVSEICEIIELSLGKVKHLLADSRNTLKDLFEERCAITSKKGVCHQCSELQGLFNPKLDAHREIVTIQQQLEIENSESDKILELRERLVKTIKPYHQDKESLHDYLMNHLKEINKLT